MSEREPEEGLFESSESARVFTIGNYGAEAQPRLRRAMCQGEKAMTKTKVKHLMVPLGQYTRVSKDATLYDAAVALDEAPIKHENGAHQYLALLVSDDTGRVIGKLSLPDLLRSLAYELWSLDELCRRAAEINVEIMARSPLNGEFIDADASLTRAIRQLIMGHHHSLLVTSKEEIIGILRLTDICAQVANRIMECRM